MVGRLSIVRINSDFDLFGDYLFSSFSEKDGMVVGCRLSFFEKGS